MEDSSLKAPLLPKKLTEDADIGRGNVQIQEVNKEWSGGLDSSDEDMGKVKSAKRRGVVSIVKKGVAFEDEAPVRSARSDFATTTSSRRTSSRRGSRVSERRRSSGRRSSGGRRGSFMPVILPNGVIESSKEWGGLEDTSSDEEDATAGRTMVATKSDKRPSVQAVLGDGVFRLVTAGKDWEGAESSSDEEVEVDAVAARRARYAQLARKIEADEEKGEAKEAADEEAARIEMEKKRADEAVAAAFRRKLCFYCCFFFLLYNSMSVFLLILLVQQKGLVMVVSLAPPAIFMAALEIFLVHTDRDIMSRRATLLRHKNYAGAAVFYVYSVVCLGCFFGYRLWRAYHYYHGYDFQRTFIEELDALDASRQVLADRTRWDSHYLLWAVPIVVSLTYLFSVGDPSIMVFRQGCFWFFVLAVALSSLVTQTLLYDYSASNWIRAQYGLVFDGYKWVKRSDDALQQFQREHKVFRCTEVLGRLLVFAAFAMCLPYGFLGFGTLMLLDFSLLFFFMSYLSTTRLTSRALLVSVPLLVVNLSRYVDEPGFALPARRFSQLLRILRIFELFLAVTLCLRNLHTSGFLVLLTLIIVVHGIHFAISRSSILGHWRGDLFTAVVDGDLDAAAESLTFEGGCTVDMPLRDSTGQTALHLATTRGSQEAVEFLLKNSADPGIVDAAGDTSLHLACKFGHVGIVALLLQPQEGKSDSESSDDDSDDEDGKPRRATPSDLVQKMNHLGQDAVSIVKGLQQGHQQQELLALLEAAITSSKSEPEEARPSRTTSEALSLAATEGSRYDMEVAGGAHLHVWVGPRPKESIGMFPGLASFMFSRGIGDQLERLMEADGGSEVRFSRLRTEQTLGAGGFGKVVRVHDVYTGVFYAAKLQSKNRAAKQALREVEMLHASQHPLIIRLVSIFHTTVFYGILMEFCETDLNKRIIEYEVGSSAERPEVVNGLPSETSAHYGACIMLALEFLHGRMVVFRDLKPENVLVTKSIRRRSGEEVIGDFAKLTDFGIAKALNVDEQDQDPSPRRMTMKAGTPAFMSSEALSGRDSITSQEQAGFDWIRKRDWYGLGCCLILMLLGEKGGRRVTVGKHEVLLPLASADSSKLLMDALDKELLSEDAYDVLSGLLAEKARNRADSETMRTSRFFMAAIKELEKNVEGD